MIWQLRPQGLISDVMVRSMPVTACMHLSAATWVPNVGNQDCETSTLIVGLNLCTSTSQASQNVKLLCIRADGLLRHQEAFSCFKTYRMKQAQQQIQADPTL